MAEHVPTTRRNPIHPGAASGRRTLLGGGAALLALAGGGAAVAKVPAPNPDAELLRLGAELEAAWAGQDAAAELAETDEELGVVMDRAGRFVARIEHLPAYTLAGLIVKARAISWCNSGYEIDPDRFCPYPGATTDGRIAASIVRDLLGRA